MKIRLANMADSQAIWEWRNDPHTRKMSANSQKISWDEHSKWYGSILASKSSLIFIGTVNTPPHAIGMVRFDIDTNASNAEVSINLNPNWRGKNISKTLLRLAIKRFRESQKTTITATIKKVNLASIRCFEACGFKFKDENESYFLYRL